MLGVPLLSSRCSTETSPAVLWPPRRSVLCLPAGLANGNQGREELEVFTPLDSLSAGALAGSGYSHTGDFPLQLHSPDSRNYPLLCPLRSESDGISGCCPGLFHQALLVFPHLPSLCEYPWPPGPHCKRAPDDWHSPSAAFSLHCSMPADGPDLPSPHGIAGLSVNGLCLHIQADSLQISSLRKILNARPILNYATYVYRLYAILDWAKPN